MSDLNLNFDTGTKSISVSNPPATPNIGFIPGLSSSPSSTPHTPPIEFKPNLSVSGDPIGFEMLTKGKAPDPVPPTTAPSANQEFSFFKPSQPSQPDTGGIVNGDMKSPTGSVNPDEAIFMNKESTDQEFKPIHRLSPQDIKNEKIDLIYKFKKLEGQGIRTTMNYNMNSHLDDMRSEYVKLKKQREVDNSIKFQRKMLMACVTGIEFLNGRFDPFSVKLDGWSEAVNENLNDYDEIFEELGDKYGGAGEMSPEIRLLFTLAGSAFMFHLTNTMFKSSIPGMDDVLRQNPELMQQFAQAAVGSMNQGGGGGGGGGPQRHHEPSPAMPPPQNPLAAMMGMGGGGGDPLASMMSSMMGGGGGGGGGHPRQPQNERPASPVRSDMSGPDGIDALITQMNLEPNKIPDLDTLSLMSGDSGKKISMNGGGNSGITLNL